MANIDHNTLDFGKLVWTIWYHFLFDKMVIGGNVPLIFSANRFIALINFVQVVAYELHLYPGKPSKLFLLLVPALSIQSFVSHMQVMQFIAIINKQSLQKLLNT